MGAHLGSAYGVARQARDDGAQDRRWWASPPVAHVPSSVTTGALHRQWLKFLADSQRAVHLALGKAAV